MASTFILVVSSLLLLINLTHVTATFDNIPHYSHIKLSPISLSSISSRHQLSCFLTSTSSSSPHRRHHHHKYNNNNNCNTSNNNNINDKRLKTIISSLVAPDYYNNNNNSNKENNNNDASYCYVPPYGMVPTRKGGSSVVLNMMVNDGYNDDRFRKKMASKRVKVNERQCLPTYCKFPLYIPLVHTIWSLTFM